MTDLAAALQEQRIKLRSTSSGDHRTVCPNCSAQRKKKTDPCLSVTVAPDGQSAVWHCWHCGYAGGTKERRETPRERTQKTYRRPAFVPKETPDAKMLEWFEKKRGIAAAVVKRNRISMARIWMPGADVEVPAIAFPYYRGGELINVKYRDKDKRFRQEKNAEKIFYGIDDIEDCKEIIIVEGEMDKLAFEEAGLLNVISVPDGAPKQVSDKAVDPDADAKFEYVWNCREELAGAEKIILATDADGPGHALAEELSRRLGRERCWRVKWPIMGDVERKDANKVLIDDGAMVLRECVEYAEPWPIEGLHRAQDYEADVTNLYQLGYEKTFSLGWRGTRDLVKARPGDLVILTGVPSHGKSEWLDAVMVNLAEIHGWNFAICSFENEPPEHYAKLAEKRQRMRFFDGPSARMEEGDLAIAMAWLNLHFFMIRDDSVSQSLDWILENAAAAVMRYGVRGVVIDPWNEIEHHRPDNKTETEYIGDALGKIRRFASNHGVWFVVVAHPRKMQRETGGKYPVPTLYDISASAHWHNKADVGIVVERLFNTTPPQTEIWVRKVRRKWVGHVGKAVLRYDTATGRYDDIEEQQGMDYNDR